MTLDPLTVEPGDVAHALSPGDNLVHSHVADDGMKLRVLRRTGGLVRCPCAQPRNLPVLNGFGGMDAPG